MEDESWFEKMRRTTQSTLTASQAEESDDDDDAYMNELQDDGKSLFRKLLREIISGSPTGFKQMQIPSQVDTSRLQQIIRREFRDGPQASSSSYEPKVRMEVSFMAIRELNKKLAYVSSIVPKPRHPQQAARGVTPLPLDPPSSYLRPGAFLIANPIMTGYFNRTVINILDHKEQIDPADGKATGTYGIIINRVAKSSERRKTLTLETSMRPLPGELASAFGSSVMREGGPVQISLQMLHRSKSDEEELANIGGILLPTIPENNEESTAIKSDKAVYYRGDILKAAAAVTSGKMDSEDVAFFAGASCWSVGQLESEIDRGIWIPCRGPVDMALSGICEHETLEEGTDRPEADLWLSMMSACGEEEAALAHLLYHEDGRDGNSSACDEEC
jgi:putative AlgH/UPF0301 family transcriptional regulator